MEPDAITKRLSEALSANCLAEVADALVAQLKSSGATAVIIEPIFRFMEAHPDEDFGAPDSLVHFMERFDQEGHEYADKLLNSLARKPTPHTVWMSNRCINGAKEPARREQLIKVLRQVQDHPSAAKNAKTAATRFLEYQRR